MNKKIERSSLILGILVVVTLIVVGVWWGMQSSIANKSIPSDTSTTETTTVKKQPVTVKVDSTQSVGQIIASLSETSSYQSYLVSSGVSSTISGKGLYTVFVPTNAAFSHLKAGSISNLSAVAKKRLVQYHIVIGRKIDPDAVYFGTIQSLSGDSLNFSANQEGQPQVNSSFITGAYQGTNGVVYIISEVLLPPTK